MPILNYRTEIDAGRTVLEIQAKLARAGARRVQIDYGDDGEPTAVAFMIATPAGDASFSLPANDAGVLAALSRQADAGTVRRNFVTRKHAKRVAWRIVKDWLEAQLALVEAGLATLDEVLFPYMLAPSGQRVYALYADRRLALPPGASEGR